MKNGGDSLATGRVTSDKRKLSSVGFLMLVLVWVFGLSNWENGVAI